MGLITATQAADYLVSFSALHGDNLTNLKLQKLLYYCQGYFIALNDEPLFDDAIQAWVHGPAIPAQYGRFKIWKNQPIVIDIDEASVLKLPAEAETHMQEILSAYGHLSAWQLELLTHSETPWIEARGSLQADESCDNIISLESMKIFFKAKLVADDKEV